MNLKDYFTYLIDYNNKNRYNLALPLKPLQIVTQRKEFYAQHKTIRKQKDPFRLE